MGRAHVLAAGAALILTAGCFSPSQKAQDRLAALKIEGEVMEAQLENLEERFLGNQANVQLWEEMARRHQSVSAVACESAGRHILAMQKHLEKFEPRSRGRARRAELASAQPVLSKIGSGRSAKRRN